MTGKTIRVELSQQHDYRFDIAFGDDVPVLTSDEPAPLGTGLGPSPVQLLSAAVGNCLSDSLLFAFRKFKQAPEPIRCTVTAEVGRNADNRLRVLNMTARIQMGVAASALEQVDHVLAQFEEFCTVTQSVRQGIPISVEVWDAAGVQLK
jgi:uncharacterized OsmC-like protein